MSPQGTFPHSGAGDALRACRRGRTEARTEKVSTLNLAVADSAEEVMLDHKRLALLDPSESIREMEAVSDFIAARVE